MDRYETKLAAAFVRGTAIREDAGYLPRELVETPLDDLTEFQLAQIIAAGERAGLKMYHFKKMDILPRVRFALGFLRAVQPETLLDVGSGRGVFLFPFLAEFPWTKVTSVDLLPHRVAMMHTIALGGVGSLTALQQDICNWSAEDSSWDVVTLLEVLEHIPDVEAAVRAAVRLAKRYVVVTVPSKPDNNPEHIHLLTKERLTALFAGAGCTRLQFGGVPGHLTMIATLDKLETKHETND